MKTTKVTIDSAACKACGYCRLVCSKEVFRQGDALNQKGYRPYQAACPEKCVGCSKCFYACPDFAITLTEEVTDETII